MNLQNATGLGDPEPIGKKSLFQPPTKKRPAIKKFTKPVERPTKRLWITTDLTKQAMETIQILQNRHRLQTGKVLPTWKIVSAALEKYGRGQQGENSKSA